MDTQTNQTPPTPTRHALTGAEACRLLSDIRAILWCGAKAGGWHTRSCPNAEASPRKPVPCDYMSPTYGCCQLPAGHDGCHVFDGHKLSK